MKLLPVYLMLATLVQAQDGLQRFTHRYDVRIRENDRYIGLMYGGGRGVVRRQTGPSGTEIVVDYLIQEETNRNLINVERFLEQEIFFRYPATAQGRVTQQHRYPFHEGFPTLPPDGVQPGAVWTGTGFWTVRPLRDRPSTRIPVLIEYREAGTGVWGNRPAIIVTGLYALRYRRGQDAWGDPELSNIQGRHELTLYLDMETQRPFFMRLKMTEQYSWADGKRRLHEGFHLIWMEDGSPLPPIPTLPRTVAVLPPESRNEPASPVTLGPSRGEAPGNVSPGGPSSGPSATSPNSEPGPVAAREPGSPTDPTVVRGPESPLPSTPPVPTMTSRSEGPGPAVLPLPTEPEVSIRQTERGIILTPENLLFVADRAELLPNQDSKLQSIVRLLQSQPERSIMVVGHTADVGRPNEELSLSRERAQKVAELLIRMGVEGGRIFMEGRGSREPRAPNTTEAQRALNRRVEIILRND